MTSEVGSGYQRGFFSTVMVRHTVSVARSNQAQIWLQLYSSAVLLEELEEVLTRPSASKRLAAIDKNARTVLADYAAAIELVTPTHIPRVVLNDPDDDHVIAAALAARADFPLDTVGIQRKLGQAYPRFERGIE